MKIMSIIGLTVAVAMSFGGNPTGYLPRIGPAPLRFAAPSKGPDITVNLPPLVMSDPPAPAHEVTTNETVTVEAPPQSVATTSPPPQPPVVVEPAFTPQMLLQFFNRNGSTSTNQEPHAVV